MFHIAPPSRADLCSTQASLWFTVGWRIWRCWKPPSLVLKVSTETASLLWKTPRTGFSAPLCTLGGATTRSRTPTLTLLGNCWRILIQFKVHKYISHLKLYILHSYRKTVKETIIEKFAGPYDRGEYSPSVQKTLYETQVLVLDRLPEVLHEIIKFTILSLFEIHKLFWQLHSWNLSNSEL